MKKSLKLGALFAVFALGACQQPSMYEWGAYDAKLLAYYKDVSHLDAFEAELFAMIEQAEGSDKRLAPGIYAEYGYLQMQKGDLATAVQFFKREKKIWPESKVLMETMIRAAGGQSEDQGEEATPAEKES